MKVLIFDASTLITLAMNGLLGELRKLKKIFDGKFIITKDVKREVIEKPMKINRFKLEAIKVRNLVDEKVLEMALSLGIKDNEINSETEKMKKVANNMFVARGREIKLIDSGEASCLALSRILTLKKIENVIVVDERTARMLGEKPENLEKLLQRKLHTIVRIRKKNFNFFKGFKFIRSAELVYVVHKKGLIKMKNGVLEALLYAVKSKGCAISGDEIKQIKKIG